MKKGFGETAAIKELVLSSMPKIISNTASNAGNLKFRKSGGKALCLLLCIFN